MDDTSRMDELDTADEEAYEYECHAISDVEVRI